MIDFFLALAVVTAPPVLLGLMALATIKLFKDK